MRFWAGFACGKKIRWRTRFELARSNDQCQMSSDPPRKADRCNFQSLAPACILHADSEEVFHGTVVTAEIFSYVTCRQFWCRGRQSFWTVAFCGGGWGAVGDANRARAGHAADHYFKRQRS